MGVWTFSLGAIVTVIAAALWGWEMGLGVISGAAIGWGNLWVLSRALRSMVERAEDYRPAPGSKWALPTTLLIKWPLLLAVLGLVLLYTPARPEGVAIGAVLSLLAASVAAMRSRGAEAPPE
jgi:hypothetical protein